MNLIRILLLSLSLVFVTTQSFAVTEFVSKICATGGTCTDEDYNLLSTWEAAMDDAGSLTDGGTKCGDWDNQVGVDIADATAVTWDGGASTGTLIHMTNRSGANQYLIDVTGGTLADNDTVDDGGGNTFDVMGAPDSCIITAEVFDDDGDIADLVDIDGTTTDSTNYFKVTVPSAERHDGTVSSGAKVKQTFTGDNQVIIDTGTQGATIIEWLIIEWNNSGSDPDFNKAYRVDRASNIIRNCIVYVNSKGSPGIGANSNHGISIEVGGVSGQQTNHMLNNIVYGFNHTTNNWHGIEHGSSADVRTHIFNSYNNTTYNNDIGVKAGDGTGQTHNIKNNIAIDNDTDFSFGTGTNNNDFNASSDATATGANSLDSGDGDPPDVNDFVSTSDFHLVTGAPEIDAGTDLGTTNGVNFDIDNRDRDAEVDTWDMGADEFVSAAVGRRVIIISKNKEAVCYPENWYAEQERGKCKIGNKWIDSDGWKEWVY